MRSFGSGARASLAQSWPKGPESPPLVQRVDVEGDGSVDLAFFDPYLAGGVASGVAKIDFDLGGPLDSLDGSLRLSSPSGRVSFLSPYTTEFSNLDLALRFDSSAIELETFTADLNRGRASLAGKVDLGQVADLQLQLSAVRYRLDYGLSAELSGDLSLRLPLAEPAQRGELTGDIFVERGLVRRDIDLEREVLRVLFAPVDAGGGPSELAETLDLDLTVTTRAGVRVRNNVADLRAFWSPISVRGTLAEPRVAGTVDVEPGGLIRAYGQTLRLDKATVSLRGQPGVEPELDFITTSSLEDPSVGRGSASSLDPFAREPTVQEGRTTADAVLGGVTQYFGERVLGNVTNALGGAFGGAFTIRPVLVLTETDPTAQLVVMRDVTEHVAVGGSFDMRSTEDRTYLLDFRDFQAAPTLSGQIFTNEERNEGVTLEQTFQLGGARNNEPKVAEIDIEVTGLGADRAPSARRIERGLDLGKGDPLVEGGAFDIELGVEEYLRRSGFPAPEVQVTVEDDGLLRDVNIVAKPGVYGEVEFLGLRPSRRLRDAIAGTYRSDFYQRASLAEMAKQTASALRNEGWLSPQVEANVVPEQGEEDRKVTVRASAIRRASLQEVAFLGVDADAARRLTEVYSGRGQRVLLAERDASTQQQLLDRLDSLGWPAARIADISVSEAGDRLEVNLEPGARAHVASIEISGLDDATEQQRLTSMVELEAGAPLVSSSVGLAAVRLENDLRDRGYGDARVTAVVPPPIEDGIVRDVAVELAVSTGPHHQIAEVTAEGLKHTHEKWALQVAGVDAGATLDSRLLADTRRRLLGTGIFDTVWIDTIKAPDGETRLVLEFEERPTYSVGYGLRWENDEGLGAVVDVLDRNFLGRGVNLGGRLLVTERRESARVFASLPRALGSRYSVESYAELRDENEDGILTDSLETSLQLARPLSRFSTGRVYARHRSQRIREEVPDPFFPFDIRIDSPFLGLQYIFDNRRDAPVFDQPGTFASVDLSGSSEAIGSDFKYLRLFAQLNHNRRVFEIGNRNFSWAQSFRIGLAETFDRDLIRDLRFFAGGEYSVRGYPTESLGPTEQLGDVRRALGGEALLVLNQELRFPILGRFNGLAFLDVGNVWATPKELGDDLRSSLGLGLRVRSPVGLIRLDVAFPLDREEGDPSQKFYLGIGHVF